MRLRDRASTVLHRTEGYYRPVQLEIDRWEIIRCTQKTGHFYQMYPKSGKSDKMPLVGKTTAGPPRSICLPRLRRRRTTATMIHAGKKFANKADLRRAVINASNYHGVAVRVRTIRSEKQRISFGCHSVTRRGNNMWTWTL